MAPSKFEKLWQLLSTSDFEIEGGCSDDVICSFCLKLMNDPYVAICGCQFCRDCVTKDRLKCKGDGEDCKKEYLEIDKTVFQDFKTRCGIGKVIVKCPQNPCSFTSALESMGEHIRACSARSKSCPYKTIGCPGDSSNDRTLEEHMVSNMLAHSQLVVEVNKNLSHNLERLENIVKKINETTEENMKEIKFLKEDSKVVNEEISRENEEMKRNMTKTLKDHAEHYGEMEARTIRNEENIGVVKDSIYRVNSSLLSANVEHDFLWTVSNLSKKKGWFESDFFYIDDYKLCLELYVGLETVYLYFRVLNGEEDAPLLWSMKHDATLTIVNQRKLTAHKTIQISYDTAKIVYNSTTNKLTNSKRFTIREAIKKVEKGDKEGWSKLPDVKCVIPEYKWPLTSNRDSILAGFNRNENVSHQRSEANGLKASSSLFSSIKTEVSAESRKRNPSQDLPTNICPKKSNTNHDFIFGTPSEKLLSFHNPPFQTSVFTGQNGATSNNTDIFEPISFPSYLWISLKDISNISGLLCHDCIMVSYSQHLPA